MIKLLAAPTFATCDHSSTLLITAAPVYLPPFIPKTTIEPEPFGTYFAAKSFVYP